MRDTCDVLVIGGGPAGSTVAALLAEKGHHVVLLEKERFPRFHVGESLVPGAWDVWQRLGIAEEIEQSGFAVKTGANFAMFDAPEDVTLLTGEYPEYFQRPYAYHVERARFDELLLNHARRRGADAREGWTVTDVLFDEGRVAGSTARNEEGRTIDIRARLVVDATGRASLMARRLGWRRPDPRLNKVAYFTHIAGAHRHVVDGAVLTDIHTVDGGWIWYIPLSGDVVSVGAVLDAGCATVRETHGPQARFDRAVSQCGRIHDWIAGGRQILDVHSVSNISYQNHCFVGDNFVLIGDAAIYVDPIFSAGVTLAMRGGMFAADAIDDALQAGDVTAGRLAPYEARIREPMQNIFSMIYNWYKVLDEKDPHNLIYLSRRIPHLRERLIVLLSGGYDRVGMEALVAASAARPKVSE